MRFAQSLLTYLLGMIGIAMPAYVFAEGDSSSSSEPAVFVNTMAGFTFYKSKLVQNNDMVMTYSYTAGVYGGDLRKVGIVLEMENGNYNFGWNGAKINSSTLDASIRYQLSPFFAGIILNNNQLAVSAPPDADGNGYLDQGVPAREYMKTNSRGLGAIIGTNVDINKMASIYGDVTMIETVDVDESYIENQDQSGLAQRKSVKIGRKSKLNIGGLVQLTKKNLDFNFGYQFQQVPITADGTTYDEKRDTLFAGLRFRASF